jgi:hypothetical protein
MILKMITLVCLALFVLKILWNLRVPYVMLGIMWKHQVGDAEPRGVSVLPLVELPLLVGWIALAAIVDSQLWIYDARFVSAAGVAVAVGSYLHLLIVALFGTWMISCAKSNETPDVPSCN